MADQNKPPRSGDSLPILKIDSHRGLAAAQQEIANRFEANPDIARLLLVNPLSAFQDVGVEVSSEIASHILHTLQNSPNAAARRQALQSRLQEDTGERPHPLDPAWVARFLFEKLHLRPLQTVDAKPVYKPTTDAATTARQLATIPTLNVSPTLPHPDHGTAFVFTGITPGVRHLDLDTPAPQLAEASEVPQSVDLTALYFYKDLDPRAHDLLELGVIESQSTQISSPDTYRKIKSGQLPNPWGDWVTSIKFTPAGK